MLKPPLFLLKESVSPIRIIFITAVIILTALSVYSYKKNLDLISKAELVNHTNVVKFELQNTLLVIRDAENGSRAFVITGIPGYLEAFKKAKKQIPVSLRKLDSLMSDNEQQGSNMERLKLLSAEKFRFLDKVTVEGFPKDSATAVLVESQGQMDEINSHISLMLHEEDGLLSSRSSTLNRAVSFAPSVNVILAGFAILLLVFSYFKILRELEKSSKLQDDLMASNVVLEKSNTELAQFAYVASHDLQEPLRKIQTFVSRIIETETSLSPKGQDYFSRVGSSARRMQQLILDILAYSRVDSRDNQFEHTNLNAVLNTVKEQLDILVKDKAATILAKGDLPVVNAVSYQVEQVFLNLLGNALKFSRPGIPPVITISARTVKGGTIGHAGANSGMNYHHLSFTDNGIGFEPQYADRIFNIFNRLNTKESYEGNGIGLSIVKKIIDAHAGFIDAKGSFGEGAVFNVYLPV